MTPETVLAFVTPMAIIVAALIQQIQANLARKDRAEMKEKSQAIVDNVGAVATHVEEAVSKAATIESKVDQVHTLANDNLSQMTTALKIANERISGLERLLTREEDSKRAAHDVAMRGSLQPGAKGPDIINVAKMNVAEVEPQKKNEPQ